MFAYAGVGMAGLFASALLLGAGQDLLRAAGLAALAFGFSIAAVCGAYQHMSWLASEQAARSAELAQRVAELERLLQARADTRIKPAH
jgi:hypothetical protein